MSGVSSEKIKSSTQSITQLADAPVPSEVHVQVWEALPVMLTAPGGAVGNTGDEPDSLDSLDGEFTTEANATSVSLRNFQPGRYTIQVYPRIGFEGRIVPIEFGTNVNGQSRTLRVGLVKTAGVDEIAFDLSANGALSVVGQPKRPKDLTVTYSENQSETIVSWVAPSDATVTGYRVYSREEGHLNFSMDDQLAGNITNYTVGTPAVAADGSQSAREYVIVAISAIGKESFASALVSSRSIEVPHDIWLVRAEVQPMPQWVYSDPALVSGINVPVSVSIENGEYSIDGLPFTTDPGTVRSGQRIAVRVRAPDPADQSPRTGPRDQLPVASTASLSVGARVFFFSTALQPSITDPDNDGVDSVVESGVPNLDGGGTGDGNGDSIPDESQPYVASLPVSGSAYASLHVPSATALLNVQSMSPPSDSPAGVQFPYGMFRFIVTGVTERSTQVVALYVPYNTAINGYWKKNASGNWVNVATSITQQGNKTKVTFPLTEGDAFDFDTNPATITDPVGGPGILTLAANVVPVPTLSNWGKIMLLSLIAMCGALLLRRRGEALRRDI